MKIHTKSSTYINYTTRAAKELELELPYASAVAHDAEMIEECPDGRIVLGYLDYDRDCQNPLDNCEGLGSIVSAFNDRQEYLSLRENLTPYMVQLDCYRHSSEAWSPHGEGMNCQWDTSRNAGIWVPDISCVEEIKRRCREESDILKLDPTTMPESDLNNLIQKHAVVLARQACDEYTKWLNGDAYGVIVVEYDQDGVEIDHDACWGYIGHDYARQQLEEEFKRATRPKQNDKDLRPNP